MYTEFASTSKVDSYEAIRHVFHFSDTIVRWMRTIIYQFPLVKFTSKASPSMKGRNGLQQFQSVCDVDVLQASRSMFSLSISI